jgi:hypothetical protein
MDVDPREAAKGAAKRIGIARGVYNANGRRLRPSTPANREAMGAAARGAYNEIMDFLNDGSCGIGQLDKEFLALALSQLSDELASLEVQAGGSRVQRGGALLDSVKGFLRALCGTVTRTAGEARDSVTARIDAISASMNALTQADVTNGILRAIPAAAATSLIIQGPKSGLVSLAVLVFEIVNDALPNPAALAVNTFSGLTAWAPLVTAAAPLAGKLLTLALCYKALQLTREFVARKAREGGAFVAANHEAFLRELTAYVYAGITAGARGAGAAAMVAPGMALRGAMATPAALAGAAAAGGRAGGRAARAARAAGGVVMSIGEAIDRAMRRLAPAGVAVAPIAAVIVAAGGDAGAAGGGGAGAAAPLPDAVMDGVIDLSEELDELPAAPHAAPRTNQLSNVESNSNATVMNQGGGKRYKRKSKSKSKTRKVKKTRKNRK